MPSSMRIVSVLIIALSVFLAACGAVVPAPSPPPSQAPPAGNPPEGPEPVPEPELSEEEQLAEVAAIAVNALKQHDLIGLSEVVHPNGVRFSPYGHVAVAGDYPHLVLTHDDLIAPGALEIERTWGVYDGSGEPIVLTMAKFIDKFLYNKDYAAASEIVWNEVIGTGNIILNHEDVYPDSVFVEYYVPGTDQYAGMDWGSLRLIFAKHGDLWLIVGMIHDQWTI